jgi:hypothetical protein
VAEGDLRAPVGARTDRFGRPAVLRLGLWSLAALAAVLIAVLVAGSEKGLRRIAMAVSGAQPSAVQSRDTATDATDVQRLTESLRQINSDRLRLLARLEAIERHLDDLTGSISRGATVTALPDKPTPVEASNAPVTGPPAAPGAIAVVSAPTQPAAASAPPTNQQPPSAAPAQDLSAEPSVASKTDFGIDLGGAPTVEGLRALWTSLKGRHGVALEGLRPIVTIREPSRPGTIELRLVAGPIPTATLAAKLCVAMNAAGAICQPALFDGQRLALR